MREEVQVKRYEGRGTRESLRRLRNGGRDLLYDFQGRDMKEEERMKSYKG
jgi:hypothetical protein